MEKLTFAGSLGEDLSARLDKPDGEIKSYALFAHCFTCGKDIFAASRISKALNERDIAVMRFDFTGLGASDGDFANTNFSSNVGDLVKAADTMREQFEAPSLIIGHSFGGAAVLRAAHDIDEVKAVATIAAPADIAHIKHHFDEHEEEIIETGEAEVLLANRPFKIKKQFLDDIKENNTKEHIANLKRALLVMHSPTDDIVGIENAAMIYDAAKHPKSFISLYEADHLLRGREHVDYAARIIAAWASKYIDL